MTRVTINDFRTVGVCPKARTFFFDRHGLNWREFIVNGIEPEKLRATEDCQDLVEACIDAAKAREARGGN